MIELNAYINRTLRLSPNTIWLGVLLLLLVVIKGIMGLHSSHIEAGERLDELLAIKHRVEALPMSNNRLDSRTAMAVSKPLFKRESESDGVIRYEFEAQPTRDIMLWLESKGAERIVEISLSLSNDHRSTGVVAYEID